MAKRPDRSERRRAAWLRSESERVWRENAAAPTAKPTVQFSETKCVIVWSFPDGSTSEDIFKLRQGSWIRIEKRLVPAMVKKSVLERSGVPCRIRTAPGAKRSTSFTHLTGGVRGSVMVAEYPASCPKTDPGKFDEIRTRHEYSESEFLATLAMLQRLAMT